MVKMIKYVLLCIALVNYASKTIFKHRRICKICTKNIWAHYMKLFKHVHSFLVEKFDLVFIENKFLFTSLIYMKS
jgi:hypothetical protein